MTWDVQNFMSRYMLHHIVKVAALGKQNKMNEENLAVVFGPSLLHPGKISMEELQTSFGAVDIFSQKTIIQYFISNYKTIFKNVSEKGNKWGQI